jgi:hypothetical protein
MAYMFLGTVKRDTLGALKWERHILQINMAEV